MHSSMFDMHILITNLSYGSIGTKAITEVNINLEPNPMEV
jgi:hypothetical protein